MFQCEFYGRAEAVIKAVIDAPIDDVTTEEGQMSVQAKDHLLIELFHIANKIDPQTPVHVAISCSVDKAGARSLLVKSETITFLS
jgi:hypothetical protein